MREIKFRAWTGANMEHRIMVGHLGAFFCPGLDPKDSASMTPMNTIYPAQTPIMQYTGLKDKNGVEIYEGDIFNCMYHRDGHTDHHYSVKYSEDIAGFVLKLHGNPCPQDGVFQRLSDVARGGVIGNIYENPELVK
jgi:uncharacterized phage protein (TIGR01671 family)